ncbi:MAG TPA: glucose-6-phosphate dehydrogenase [Sulfurovum sp.]|jgi:glucose-6-phosphate 1-dehydrogenase|nr:MAG: glucose-6-phosphate dehydrogenase [Sulfurovum sp. 35-42-20]OYZ25665.1 MAG: glucose-6-phosphate dehydrogenase [Sulfurovum sp. 16-42-52]OYZ50208.1 MAG: glucose-6-phosphate dehydrogenase [Sulfurovum sp. 24-42-9]OZA45782.1 MAG: glucose-6-phosphate dehydrogenase [Sulfurovum sp. 17-42-90]OZA60254.1 MAG: glucose-6-phosphate dehydrogenase [Sulfurovum sp. 39-42-12]HQR73291.1 glucose-6-phosphate dehydrogenase [Sulfurovum sp.]
MNEIKSDCDIIVFGGHGDLAFRKLMPALYHLSNNGYIDETSRIITATRDAMSLEEHCRLTRSKLQEFLPEADFDEAKWLRFEKQLQVVIIDFGENESYSGLKALLDAYPQRDRVNYLSTAPDFFGAICKSLSQWELISPQSRVVLEKPIGRDLHSSRVINVEVLKYFDESQIYRIDHYLGKDTVQNIMALRFSNRFFMPLWDASNIDHIQITVAESVGVEGRWGYYDEYGAMRDMIQNHLMQLLCLVAMEPPCSVDADNVRDEKVKVLRSLRLMTPSDIEQKTVRAQYTQGASSGEPVPGYREGEGVSESNTETFAAIRVDIDNWRWNGVPFYLRSGKRMRQRNSEIVIYFKAVPHSIFVNQGKCISENKLVISLQPKESIHLQLMNKIPGLSEHMRLQKVELELNTPLNTTHKPDAYERLLLDVIRANPTLFMRLDEVEAAWKWADVILKGWQEDVVPMKSYSAGTDGPSAAVQLIARDGRSWHDE